MEKEKVAGNPAVDPTFPKVALVLGKETHYLVFTFEALAVAEAKLRAEGIKANLLLSFDVSTWDATRLLPMLYAAMITHQPGIAIAAVTKLITFRNMDQILEKLYDAWKASLEEPVTGDEKKVPLADAK